MKGKLMMSDKEMGKMMKEAMEMNKHPMKPPKGMPKKGKMK